MILAFTDHAMLEVLQLDLNIYILELIGASRVQEPFLSIPSNQLMELDILQLLKLSIIDDLDVLESEWHFPLLPLPFSLLFLGNDLPVLELPS